MEAWKGDDAAKRCGIENAQRTITYQWKLTELDQIAAGLELQQIRHDAVFVIGADRRQQRRHHRGHDDSQHAGKRKLLQPAKMTGHAKDDRNAERRPRDHGVADIDVWNERRPVVDEVEIALPV